MLSAPEKPVRVWSVFRAYGKAARAYPWLLASLGAAIVGTEAAGVIAPLYLRQFIDLLSGGPLATTLSALFSLLGMFTAIHAAGWLMQRAQMLALNWTEVRVMSGLYASTFSYLIGHGHEFFISQLSGTLTRRVTRYVRSFEQVFDTFFFNFFPTFMFAVGVIAVLAVRNVWLGAGLVAWTILFVGIQIWMALKRQPLRVARSEEDSKVTGYLSDAVTNHSTITTFASLAYETAQFKETVARWYAATKRSWDADTWMYGVQGFFALLIEIALLAGAVLLWQRGIVTVGDFVLIQVYVISLLERLSGIGGNMRHLYDAFADATEMIAVLETPHAIRNVPGAKPLRVTEGAIAFDRVYFEYPGNRAVLRDFSLRVAPREKIAIVGSSGAGKSTVIKLLLRLYDIGGGDISIDGQNIAAVTHESLRSSIAFVPQEPLLFHRSLMENIRYGRRDATDKEVIKAAERAHCLEFIGRYPEGFGTLVGERGVKLSGGERQRVAIARAILKDAPILVLDEATSSLDSESERFIQDTLGSLMEGKTVIAIAHRLSTIMHMNRLVIMERGAVTLSGTHRELLAQKGNLYKKLWEIQAGGFIRAD